MGEMADFLLEQADADVDEVLEAPRKTGGSKRHIHQQAKERHCSCVKSGSYWYCDHYVCSRCGGIKEHR